MQDINLQGLEAFVFLIFVIWIAHKQYIKGHDTLFFEHKSPEEKRIREAQIKILEHEAEGLKEMDAVDLAYRLRELIDKGEMPEDFHEVANWIENSEIPKGKITT